MVALISHMSPIMEDQRFDDLGSGKAFQATSGGAQFRQFKQRHSGFVRDYNDQARKAKETPLSIENMRPRSVVLLPIFHLHQS